MEKETIQQQKVMIVNIYDSNVGTPTFIRQTQLDLQAQIDRNTVIMREFNNSLSPTDTSSQQNINKESSELNHTVDQMDLIDIYRIFHLAAVQYTFFSTVHGTFSKIDIIGHKASFNK
jgi:exonuclease III